MAINQPNGSTSIQERTYSDPTNEASLKALLLGISGGNDRANKRSAIAQEANETRNTDTSRAKIKDDAQGREMDRIKALGLKAGDSARVGDTMISKNGEGRMEAQRTAAEAKAIKAMQDTYNHGTPKMQDQLQALSELTDTLQHPNQMSQGVARTLLLKSFGMNRYNGDEAKAVLPGSLQGSFAKIMGGAGGDASTLTSDQIKDVAQLRDHAINAMRQRHDTLKQQALQQYASSPYADVNKAKLYGEQLGSPFSQQLEGLSKSQIQAQQPSQLTQPAAEGGIVDKLANWFKGGSGKQQQAQPQTMRVRHKATGQTGTVPANEFDPQVYDQIGQ